MADLPSGGRPADSTNGAIHRQDQRAVSAPGVMTEDRALAEVGDRAALARLTAAAQRDKLADLRDDLARSRDAAADVRTIALARLQAASKHDEDTQSRTGAEAVIRAVGQRRRAAERRMQAAEDRELAALDREAAAQDREDAARERRQALGDRESLVAELHAEQHRRTRAEDLQHRAEALTRALQRCLPPPGLPGLDVALHYEFALDEVGDFCDLLPLAGGRSGFFLGDVCGNGPDATTLTSLVRQTMRAAAMARKQPDAILTDLNAALMLEGGETLQPCTAVYGEIDMERTDALTLAVAGHPAPLVVRAHGSVEATAACGSMLGVSEHPVFHSCELSLAEGDTVLVYSDGILESEERFAELLQGAPSGGVQALVDRLAQAIREVDRPLRDDFALLALRRTAG